MNLSRFITEDRIKLELDTVIEPFDEVGSFDKWQQSAKETLMVELVSLVENGNRTGNSKKLLNDFINRERKATTGIGDGIAIPHVRSLQAKEFMMAFARSTKGFEFDTLDKKPAHLFFIMAAPPYEDALYLKVYKALAEMLQYESFREELTSISSPGELIRAMRSME